MKDKEQASASSSSTPPDLSPRRPADEAASAVARAQTMNSDMTIQEKRKILFAEDGLKNEDLQELTELGAGNGGSVKKVEHTPSGTLMAKKVKYSFYHQCLKANVSCRR